MPVDVTDSISYQFAETVLDIKAQATVRRDHADKNWTRSDGSYSLTVATAADPQWGRTLKLDRSWLHDREFALSFTEDGRLSGGGLTSTGVAGALLTSVAKGVGTAAAMGAFSLMAADDHVDLKLIKNSEVVDPRAAYAKEHPDLAKQANDLRTALASLDARLVTLVSAKDLDKNALDVVAQARTQAEALLERLDTSYEAWLAHRERRHLTTTSLRLTLDQVPSVRLLASTRDEIDDLKPPSLTGKPYAQFLADRFGLIVATHDPHRLAKPSVSPSETASMEVQYRLPRRLTILVWVEGLDGQWVLDRRQSVLAVDQFSRVASLPLHESLFGKNGSTYKFSESGALTELSTTRASAIGGVATALGGLPGDLSDAWDKGDALAKHLHPDAAAALLAKTEQRQKQMEADIAIAEAGATQAQAAELARLKQQAEILKARTGTP